MGDGGIHFGSVSVTGGQANIGETNIEGGQNQNNSGGGPITISDFLGAIKAELPEAEQARVEVEILAPLREAAAQPEPTNEQDRTTLKARIYGYLSQLEPYTPYIRKTLAAFAEGALSAIPPPASWVIAGCVEVVRDARKD